jgi:hypothetical protein
MDVIETFVTIFLKFYKDSVHQWNQNSRVQNDKKLILTSFSTDLNLYNKVKSQLNIFGQEVKSKTQPLVIDKDQQLVSRALEKLFHSFHNHNLNPKFLCGKKEGL